MYKSHDCLIALICHSSDLRRDRLVENHFFNSPSPLCCSIAPLFKTRIMYPISMCRGSISFCLIVVQLSVASGTLNIEQFQSDSDPSSSPSLFPGPDGSGFTGNLGLSSSDSLMVPFNNGGDFELASGDKNCAPGPKRRGKRRARRDDQTFCPNNLQVRQLSTRKK